MICVALGAIDVARFGALPPVAKSVVVGSLTSLPMLFSGIIFIRSFAAVAGKDQALGANLIGSLAGALLQSVTFLVGIRALLWIVAGLYFAALCTRPRVSKVERVDSDSKKSGIGTRRPHSRIAELSPDPRPR